MFALSNLMKHTMKTTCLLNFLSLAFVIACNFEFSDIPYFDGIVQNAYHTSSAFLKLFFKGVTVPTAVN